MFTKTYKVPVKPSDIEAYEQADNNTTRVTIQNGTVIIQLTRDAMLGLGTELIRWALDGENSSGEYELRPSRKNDAVMTLGTYLHSDSAPVFFIPGEFPTVDEQLDSLVDRNR